MPRIRVARHLNLPRPILAAAGFAAAEIIVDLLVGRFFAWGRAEALLFLAFRPWLALALALVMARSGLSARLGGYALALGVAGLSESLFLLALGAANPWPEMLRGLAAGALLILVIDGVLRLGRRFLGKAGLAAGALAAALLFLIPGGLRGYEAILMARPAPPASAQPPALMLMTGLPIIWGEGGAFDPESRPARGYAMLQAEYRLRLLDLLDPERLATGRLLLLAQPRRLAPAELAALDQWLRRGGRALILTDPSLLWPSKLPLGDLRRPPPVGLLGPLLDHWGLTLHASARSGLVVLDMESGRRLAMAAPGTFTASGGRCTVEPGGLIARCRLGRGAAMLVADADLMDDRLWVAPGPNGDARHLRLADNPLIVADWLDSLAGVDRPRIGGEVAWLRDDANRPLAHFLAALPILLVLACAWLVRSRRG